MSKFVFLLFFLFSSQSVFAQTNHNADSALADLLGTIFGRKIEQGQSTISRNRYIAQQSGDKRYLRQGDESAAVKAWQTFLKSQNLYSGPIDGKFGSGTSQATKAFQNNYGLKADGILGENTIDMAKEVADTGIVREMSSVSTDAGRPISQSDFSGVSQQTEYPIVNKPITNSNENYSEQMSLPEVAKKNDINLDNGQTLVVSPNTLSSLNEGLGKNNENKYFKEMLDEIVDTDDYIGKSIGNENKEILDAIKKNTEDLEKTLELAKKLPEGSEEQQNAMGAFDKLSEENKRLTDQLEASLQAQKASNEQQNALLDEINQGLTQGETPKGDSAKPEEGFRVVKKETTKICDSNQDGKFDKEKEKCDIYEATTLVNKEGDKGETIIVKTTSGQEPDAVVGSVTTQKDKIKILEKAVPVCDIKNVDGKLVCKELEKSVTAEQDPKSNFKFISPEAATNMIIPEAPKQTAEVK